MGYTPAEWLRRISQFPDRYGLTALGGGLYTITPSEGNVTQEGTPLTENALNHLETQYAEAIADLTTHKTNATPPGVHRWTAGKLLKGAGAGANPTEIDVPGLTIVRKTADETVNNSNVLQNDDHLLFAIEANEVWLVEVYLLQLSVSVDSDIKLGWAYPANCSIKWGSPELTTASYWHGVQSGVTPNVIYNEIAWQPLGCGNLTQAFRIIALVINGANAGNINLQWAQYGAIAEDTKVLANSCLIAHKLA